jgi:hypothetical protein
MAEIQAKLLESARDEYRFVLTVDDDEQLEFVVKKDGLAMIKRKLELAFKIAALLPLLLGLFFAFHNEVLSSVRRLMRALINPRAAIEPGGEDRRQNGL